MDFKTYFFDLSVAERIALAKECGTSSGHLRNVAYGFRKPAPELALALERATKRKVVRQKLLPDTFKAIWPNLKAV